MKQLKLTVEPVPVFSAGKSLSNLPPKSRWDKIRKRVYAEYGHRCAICGVDPKNTPVKVVPRYGPKLEEAPEPHRSRAQEEAHHPSVPRIRLRKMRLECHEEWKYDEENRIQRLSDLLALCTWCHQIKHWNWAATELRLPSGSLEKVTRKEVTLKEVMQETRRLFEACLREGDVQGAKQYLEKGGHYISWVKNPWWRACLREMHPNIRFLEDHFMWVNDCGMGTLIEHVDEAAEVCFRRSQHLWEIDFGEFAEAFRSWSRLQAKD
jgi:5-methylcytosine-specific restriction endonuclease McrA